MFFQEKLLTSIKNYLDSEVLLINDRYSSHYYCHSICDWFNIKISWEDFRSNFQQKKADEKKYNDLKEKIFFPLSSNIVGLNETRLEDIPSLILDPLRIHQSEPNHFEEAKKHFKKIKVLKRFEDLKERVSRFNENLTSDDRKIVEIVSKYFEETGFGTTRDVSNPPTDENIVLINKPFTRIKIILALQGI